MICGKDDENYVIQATPEKLYERLLIDRDDNSTYIEDFLLTSRTFGFKSVNLAFRLLESFIKSSKNCVKVYEIVLKWITSQFVDFETNNQEMYDFLERFQEVLKNAKMNNELKRLNKEISLRTKQRVITLTRSQPGEDLGFTVEGYC